MVMPMGKLKVAAVPAPLLDPGVPAIPAKVETVAVLALVNAGFFPWIAPPICMVVAPGIVMVSCWEALPAGLAESVTVTVKVPVVLPGAGVPDSTPELLRVSPAGSEPDTVQV